MGIQQLDHDLEELVLIRRKKMSLWLLLLKWNFQRKGKKNEGEESSRTNLLVGSDKSPK